MAEAKVIVQCAALRISTDATHDAAASAKRVASMLYAELDYVIVREAVLRR